MPAPDSASFRALNALRYLVRSYVTSPTTIKAMTEIPANTPKPMGKTCSVCPGTAKAADADAEGAWLSAAEAAAATGEVVEVPPWTAEAGIMVTDPDTAASPPPLPLEPADADEVAPAEADADADAAESVAVAVGAAPDDTPLALTAPPPEAAVEEADDPEFVSVDDDPELDVSVEEEESALVVVDEEESEELDDEEPDEEPEEELDELLEPLEPLFTLLIVTVHVLTS